MDNIHLQVGRFASGGQAVKELNSFNYVFFLFLECLFWPQSSVGHDNRTGMISLFPVL